MPAFNEKRPAETDRSVVTGPRFVSVLEGIIADVEIEAVPLIELEPGDRLVPAPYRFRVGNGFHRFYASIAAGFDFLPATVKTARELLETSRNLGWRE